MSLAIPKKKKIIRVIIIIASLVAVDLENEINGTIYETLMSQLAQADALLFQVETWTQDHEDAWTAFEAIYDAFDPEAVGEPNPSQLSSNFADALSKL